MAQKIQNVGFKVRLCHFVEESTKKTKKRISVFFSFFLESRYSYSNFADLIISLTCFFHELQQLFQY